MLKRIGIGIIAFLLCSVSVRAQSTLATTAAGMSPGTWTSFTVPSTSAFKDLIYPDYALTGASSGGVNYTTTGTWDSVNHLGYFWAGAHVGGFASNGWQCYAYIQTFTFAGTAAGTAGPFTGIPQDASSGSGVASTWNVSSTGTTYSVAINVAGGNFLVNDTVTIRGNHIGGATPANDLTITVTATNFVNTPNAACANLSERFIQFVDSSNTWNAPVDTSLGSNSFGNGNPPPDVIQVGGHPYESLAIDATTGDVYKASPYSGPPWRRYGFSDQTWHLMAANSLAAGKQAGIAWFPDANGAIQVIGGNTGTCTFVFYSSPNSSFSPDSWTTIKSNGTCGQYNTMAFYNPVLHEMLAGFGVDNTGNQRSFYKITYNGGDPTSGSNWTFTARTLPTVAICNDPSNGLLVEIGGNYSTFFVNANGKYDIIYRDASSCSTIDMKEYDSTADSYTTLTGGNIPSDPNLLAAIGEVSGGSSQMECTLVPEYGIDYCLSEITGAPTATPFAEAFLFKPNTSGSFTPTTPTLFANTAITATTAEGMAIVGTGGGGTVAGCRWKLGSTVIASTSQCAYNFTGLTANTGYTMSVATYDTDGSTSAYTSPISFTTNIQTYTFSGKCALSGVLHCDGFDSQAALKYHWVTTYPEASTANQPCTTAMTSAGLLPNNFYVYPIQQDTVPAAQWNATAAVTAVYNGVTAGCSWPRIDTAVTHSGAGSLKEPSPPHAGSSPGEYYGDFSHTLDGSGNVTAFGYVGPITTGQSVATHLADELWIQFYYRQNQIMNTFQSTHFAGNFTTASAGTTQADVNVFGTPCTSSSTLDSTIQASSSSELNGLHITFIGLGDTDNFVEGQYTITGLSNPITGGGGYCSVNLSTSPTPTAAGTGPEYGQGFIEHCTACGDVTITSPKGVGLFGNPGFRTDSHSIGLQSFYNGLNTGVPAFYNYNPATCNYGTNDGCDNGTTGTNPGSIGNYGTFENRPGCNWTTYPDPNGTIYPNPPCIRFLNNGWQEITIHIQPTVHFPRTYTEYTAVTSTGTYAGTYTNNGTDNWSAVVATFKGTPVSDAVGSSIEILTNKTSLTVTPRAGAVTAGDLVTVIVRGDGTTLPTGVADNLSNAYTQAVCQTQTTDSHFVCIYYYQNAPSGVTSVTATYASSNAYPWVGLYSWSGMATSSALDQTHAGQGTSTSITSGSTSGTSQPDELVLAAVGLPSASATTPLSSGLFSGVDPTQMLQASSFVVNPAPLGNGGGRYQMWIDGQQVYDRYDFAMCRGDISAIWKDPCVANGLGEFNLSPYFTDRDPNQVVAEGDIWFDDLIISTQPIPMLANVTPAQSDTLAKTGPLTAGTSTAMTYVINLGNSGTATSSTTLTVADQLPTGVIGTACTASTGVTSVSCGTLPTSSGALMTATVNLTTGMPASSPDGTAVFTITATAPSSAGTIINYTSVDSTGGASPPTPGPSCLSSNCGNWTTTITAPLLKSSRAHMRKP